MCACACACVCACACACACVCACVCVCFSHTGLLKQMLWMCSRVFDYLQQADCVTPIPSPTPKKKYHSVKRHVQKPQRELYPYGDKVFFCELEGYGYKDHYDLATIFESVGMTRLPFKLPNGFRNAKLRARSPHWFDVEHAKAGVVAKFIVAPIVHKLLKKLERNNEEPIYIAVIGDSTTAYCYDRAYEVSYHELSVMVEEKLQQTGHINVRVDFFARSGSFFSGTRGFFSQIRDVLGVERQYGKYDALLLIGGWNAQASEFCLRGGRRRLAYEMCKTWHESVHHLYDFGSHTFVPF